MELKLFLPGSPGGFKKEEKKKTSNLDRLLYTRHLLIVRVAGTGHLVLVGFSVALAAWHTLLALVLLRK